MRARAPGKLVLSGAYSVLWGAPALVTAVDRYAVADASRAPDLVPREIEVAVALGLVTHAPALDVSALRVARAGGGTQKLGLGSSAALLVAALVAAPTEGAPPLGSTRFVDEAVRAHRLAQGGGSGIDVAASACGGTLVCSLEGASRGASPAEAPLSTRPLALPEGLWLECWYTSREAVTSSMVAAVRGLAAHEPEAFERTLGPAREGAQVAVTACERGDARLLVEALRAQTTALSALGERAGVAIVPLELRDARARAADEHAVVFPSGAGGGDVVLLARTADAPATRAALCALGYQELALSFAAPGAHRVD